MELWLRATSAGPCALCAAQMGLEWGAWWRLRALCLRPGGCIHGNCLSLLGKNQHLKVSIKEVPEMVLPCCMSAHSSVSPGHGPGSKTVCPQGEPGLGQAGASLPSMRSWPFPEPHPTLPHDSSNNSKASRDARPFWACCPNCYVLRVSGMSTAPVGWAVQRLCSLFVRLDGLGASGSGSSLACGGAEVTPHHTA